MKKYFLLMFICTSVNVMAQHKIVFKDTILLKDSFHITVKKIMGKHYKDNQSNEFFVVNTIKDPLSVSQDSIIYNIKFITEQNGMSLWDATAKFYNGEDMCMYEIGSIKLIKQMSTSGIIDLNTSIDDIAATQGIRLSLRPIYKKIDAFLDECDRGKF